MEVLVKVLLVPVMNRLVFIWKDKLWLDGKISLAIVSVLLWLIYSLFTYVAPEQVQESAIQFVSQIGFFAVVIYEFILKHINVK